MHITDWFSSAWLNAVGQKSTSIVSDGLIGHFDPENSMSFNGIGTTFFNLVDGQLDMALVNGADLHWFSPTEQRPLGLPSYFDLDGTDDYIGPALLGYGYGPELNSFYVDGTEDFTISFWIRPRSIIESGGGYASLGNFAYNSISLGTTLQGHHAVAWPKTPYPEAFQSPGIMPGEYLTYFSVEPDLGGFRIAGPSLIQNPSPNQYKKENSNNLNFEDWQYIAITKKTNGPYGPGDSKITFYINGIECGLMGSTNYQEFGDAMPTITIQANHPISNGEELFLYLGGVYIDLRNFCEEVSNGPVLCDDTNNVFCSSNSFGLILVYNRALKRNELRQNFLATRTTHRYYSPGRGYHQNE